MQCSHLLLCLAMAAVLENTYTRIHITYLDYWENIIDSQYLVPLKTITQEPSPGVFFMKMQSG